MYQVFVSMEGGLKPGARFKQLADALRHGDQHGQERSFAVKQPDGSWYRDERGKSIMGRSGRARRSTTAQGSGETTAATETTQTRGSGPSLARGSGRFQVRFSTEEPHETTAVDWPPVAGPSAAADESRRT